jgi:DNA replication and repair protein RecF
LALLSFTASDFRCLENIELEASPNYNLIYGANASGKTSLLEAIAYLGRGKALRGATTQNLVRHGQAEFTLFGRVRGQTRAASLGVRNGRGGLEIHVDGTAGRGAADLAEILPLQAVDPEIHNLVAGGPEERRRYLDWSVFHVEHGYVQHWRRYRRALRQRNAALKAGGGSKTIRPWDAELLEAAAEVTQARGRVTETLQMALEPLAEEMLGGGVTLEYQPGWSRGKSLEEALEASMERDRSLGATHAGPHRADLRLVFNERQARRMVSRGQQKLLACTLVFASVELVQSEIMRPVLLLLDDPAAELDSEALGRLLEVVGALGCQVIATALDPGLIQLPEEPAMFHVEHGALHREK